MTCNRNRAKANDVKTKRLTNPGNKINGKTVGGSVANDRVLFQFFNRNLIDGSIIKNILERLLQSFHIFFGRSDEQIDILGQPRKTMQHNREFANENIFHPLLLKLVQNLKKLLDEVTFHNQLMREIPIFKSQMKAFVNWLIG